MRLLPKQDKNDPVKAALYDPKQFRKTSSDTSMAEGRPPHSFTQWGVLCLLCAIGCAAFYGWPKSSHDVRTHTKAVAKTAVPLAPYVGVTTPAAQDLELPPNGHVKTIKKISSPGLLELRIDGRSEGQNCAVRFDDWRDGSALLSVFVRASQSVSVKLPAGSYRVRMACAHRWGSGAPPASSVTTLTSPLVLASPSDAPTRLNLNQF